MRSQKSNLIIKKGANSVTTLEKIKMLYYALLFIIIVIAT